MRWRLAAAPRRSRSRSRSHESLPWSNDGVHAKTAKKKKERKARNLYLLSLRSFRSLCGLCANAVLPFLLVRNYRCREQLVIRPNIRDVRRDQLHQLPEMTDVLCRNLVEEDVDELVLADGLLHDGAGHLAAFGRRVRREL